MRPHGRQGIDDPRTGHTTNKERATMDHNKELKAWRERRYASHDEARRATPAWLSAGSTRRPLGTDAMMREEQYVCKPAILYQAGWTVGGYTIRTRSEEVRRDVWQDFVEVYVSMDYAMSYTWKDAIRAEVEAGNIALAPPVADEIAAMP